MRILYCTSDVPTPGHRAPGAVTIVTYEAAAALREQGHEVALQPFLAAPPSAEQSDDLQALVQSGFELNEPLLVPQQAPRRFALARDALRDGAATAYPALALADEVARRADGFDLVLHVWSPEALAACSRVEAPVYAYYGNPDHKPIAARLAHPELFGTARRRRLLEAANRRRKAANVALMRTCRWAGNVCAIDADFFADHGHPDSFYVQNMWTRNRPAPPGEAPEIVGSIGNVAATGNTFGLHFLGTEIAPALERRLGGGFTIDVCGGGAPTAAVALALDRPSIRRLGWVDDIDAKITSARIFLIANNNNPDFRVGHTRLLHAWSLGACVVAHTGLAEAMPELVHGENALLGSNGAEIAEQLASAFEDAALRERIGAGGLATFERAFTPQVVIERVLARVAG